MRFCNHGDLLKWYIDLHEHVLLRGLQFSTTAQLKGSSADGQTGGPRGPQLANGRTGGEQPGQDRDSHHGSEMCLLKQLSTGILSASMTGIMR